MVPDIDGFWEESEWNVSPMVAAGDECASVCATVGPGRGRVEVPGDRNVGGCHRSSIDLSDSIMFVYLVIRLSIHHP